MATRRRMIQPTIWQDTEFGSLTPLAQLIFIGLFSQADDEGRVRGDPRLIRNQLFPYNLELQFDEFLNAVEEITLKCRNVVFYETYDGIVCQFLKWKNHQTLRGDRVQASLLPPPPQPNVNQVATKRQPSGNHSPTSAAQVKGREVKGSKGKGKVDDQKLNYSDTTMRPVGHILDQIREEYEKKGLFPKKV